MYVPEAFREDDPVAMHAMMRAHPFALLASAGEGGLQATQLPFEADPDPAPFGLLRAHFARANPHWRALTTTAEGECLVVFQGESGYVTPSWYAEKARTHKVVPTWNYATVHAWGHARIVEDAAWLERLVAALTLARERSRAQPWAVADAPRSYVEANLANIVGVEIAVTRMQGKWKMSQNRPIEDRLGVARGLADDRDPHADAALARAVKARLP